MSVKKFIGKVVSTKMKGTVVVAVEMPKRHPIYGKTIKNTKKIKARTVDSVQTGATVEIVETRPFSKEVSFRVVNAGQDKEKE